MICALLVFQTPDLPAPLGQLSPWLDHLIAPRDQVYARLAAPAPVRAAWRAVIRHIDSIVAAARLGRAA
jgi:hypothetical protein